MVSEFARGDLVLSGFDADLDAAANALIGTLLLEVLTRRAIGDESGTRFDGLLDAILKGVSGIACEESRGKPRASCRFET
jgi:hypothetical protein